VRCAQGSVIEAGRDYLGLLNWQRAGRSPSSMDMDMEILKPVCPEGMGNGQCTGKQGHHAQHFALQGSPGLPDASRYF
jgi:hypothetical protein